MTWQKLTKEINKLREKITVSPDIIVGIVRGGIIPARLLASTLHVKNMYCLTVKKDGDQRNVVTTITEDLKGKQIVLVEDMLETGKSLIVAKKYLEDKGATVKTACLYIMPISEIRPDYYLKKLSEVVHFPWE
jgi:hypoxanthine phosphoribosyltransferase